jgi:hypothetical protein
MRYLGIGIGLFSGASMISTLLWYANAPGFSLGQPSVALVQPKVAETNDTTFIKQMKASLRKDVPEVPAESKVPAEINTWLIKASLGEKVSEPPLETAGAQPRCVPEILCNPPKLDLRYRRAYTGLSGKAFEAMPVEGRWGYISGVWDKFIYRYYFEKDEEYKWLATCFRKYQETKKINPVDAAPEIALSIKFSGDKTRPASEFILAHLRAACVFGVPE